MKLNKVISLFAAMAVAASTFVGLATVSYAAAAANSNPVVSGYVDDVTDDYATLYFDLENNESLSYTFSKGKYTSNGINMIQIEVDLDEDVFDVADSYAYTDVAGASTSGDGTSHFVFLFSPTAINSYMTTVPEHLFEIGSSVKVDSIPNDAVTYGPVYVEYTSYNGVAASAGATTYTKYAANPVGYTPDYTMVAQFAGNGTTPPADEFAAEVAASGEVTFTNTDKATDLSQDWTTTGLKLFENEFTGVTDTTRFEITAGTETKTFGGTLFEKLGISGKGSIQGKLRIGVLFDKNDYEADSFSITVID